jgi:hypothetical protein
MPFQDPKEIYLFINEEDLKHKIQIIMLSKHFVLKFIFKFKCAFGEIQHKSKVEDLCWSRWRQCDSHQRMRTAETLTHKVTCPCAHTCNSCMFPHKWLQHPWIQRHLSFYHWKFLFYMEWDFRQSEFVYQRICFQIG